MNWDTVKGELETIVNNGDIVPLVESVDSKIGGGIADGGLIVPLFLLGCLWGMIATLLRRATGTT